MNVETDKRSHYRGHVLSCHPAVLDDGRFQARVAIACVDRDAPFFQRFLDLEVCDTQELAVRVARQAGVAWIDRERGDERIESVREPGPADTNGGRPGLGTVSPQASC